MATTGMPLPATPDPILPPQATAPVRQTPWNCGWAYVAGSVRRSRTIDAPGVLWTCRLRERAAAPLFAREECLACRRWCPRAERVGAAWTSGWGESQLSSASPICRLPYSRGTPIVREGAPATVLYTLLSGTAKLLKMAPNGRAIGIDICGPGSPLGAEQILEGSSFAATAVALEDITCLAAPRRAVVDLLHEQPALVRELLSETSEHERNLMKRIEIAGARVEARFAHLFLSLACKIGVRDSHRIVIRIPLQRRDLADFTGTTVETSIRVMSGWEKRGILTTTEEGFVIHDRAALDRFIT